MITLSCLPERIWFFGSTEAIDCLPVLEDLDSGDLLSETERGPGLPAPGKARGQDGNTLPVVEEEKVPQ